ncbi:hypothetical protein C7N43_34030 [Sphingobacteriales bacterium UPWRP_1]|nr:hypothetical protein BVG80_00920 [Sphingobacteriales bacterium TSM_CSM]PSJ72467.1 hypothetical protein C7N43_34030 [Sphingobacteriales bacterium UPWRP_1]
MKQLAFVLAIAFATLFTHSLQAQDRGSAPGKNPVKLSESPQLQSKLKNTNGNAMPSRGTEDSKTPAVALNKGENMHIVRSYRIDYKPNPMSNPDFLIASMTMFDGTDNQVGMVNFYGAGSKALSVKETVTDKGVVTLAYPFELMDKVIEFVTRSQQSVLVYNTETKTAYLTMGVMPTRTR